MFAAILRASSSVSTLASGVVRVLARVDVGKRLAIGINHLQPARYLLNRPWWWEATLRAAALVQQHPDLSHDNAVQRVLARDKDLKRAYEAEQAAAC